jgi:hypothetical protein
MGGSVLYCSLTLARLGLRVGCVAGLDYDALHHGGLGGLSKEGALAVRTPLRRGPVFENSDRDGGRGQRWLSKSDPIPVEALPAAWRSAPSWLLVPVAGELEESWADVPGAGSRVVLGLQGLVREFSADGFVRKVAPRPGRLLERAGLVGLSIEDLPVGLRPELLRRLTDAVVVATAGESGGVAIHRAGHEIPYPAIKAGRVVDRTGAGDVFLAALMASWHLSGELATPAALAYAAAAASCAVEKVGLSGVPTGAAVAARLRARP